MEDGTKGNMLFGTAALIHRLETFWQVICQLQLDVAAGKHANEPDASEQKQLLHAKTDNISPLLPMMKALPHLHFPEGTVLDYYQAGSSFYSKPVFYVRREDEPRRPDNNEEIDPDDPQSDKYEFYSLVKPEFTAEGAWELILLEELGEQFNLIRHAAYNTRRIVCDMPEFFSGKYCGYRNDRLFSGDHLSNDDREKLLLWDVAPKVALTDEKAIVEYCIFSPFAGFFKVRRLIRFKPGLRMMKPFIEKKFSYSCDITG